MIERADHTKTQEFRVLKRAPSYQIVNIPRDGAVPFVDAVIDLERTGFLSIEQLKTHQLRAIIARVFRPVDLGPKPALPEITDKIKEEICIPSGVLLKLFNTGVTGMINFYSQQAIIDSFSTLPGGGQAERVRWEKLMNAKFGAELFRKENPPTQLSITSLTPLSSGLDCIRTAVKKGPLKDILTSIKEDLDYFIIRDYRRLPLNTKLKIVSFSNEDTLLVFKLLSGKISPEEVSEKHRERKEKRYKEIIDSLMESDLDELTASVNYPR